MRNFRVCLCVIAVGTLSLLGLPAQAAYVESFFTFENDGAVTDPPFGTVRFEDGVGANKLKVTVDIDNIKLGAGADIEQFGFNLNESGLTSTLVLDPFPQMFGGVALAMSYNDTVKGRNPDYDYVVDFGSGSPTLDPVMFTIGATGLTLNNLFGANSSSQNNKPDGQFHAHIQGTSAGSSGVGSSESIGGDFGTTVVPIPTALPLFVSALVGLGLVARRKAKAV